MNENVPRQSETYYTDNRQTVRERPNYSWLPLLLLPLFFVLGWVASDSYDAADTATSTPRFGIGGGPGSTRMPTPLPTDQEFVLPPTVTETASPTPEATDDEEDEETSSPTPTRTPTPTPTPRTS